MPETPYTIDVKVSIQPDGRRQDIETVFETAYRGEIGDDETLGEFMTRKLEQHVLDIYSSRKSQAAGAEIVRTQQKDLVEAATIKQKKMKPEVKAEPTVEK